MALNDLLKESKIFANREVLSPHFVPKHLIFRDKEISNIEKAIAPSLKGERGRNLFIYGKTGTGKTTCTLYVVNEVREIPNTRAKITYINCKIIGDHMPAYAKRGYGTVDLYEKLTNWIEEDNKILIVALDEIDMVKDLDDLIYTLTRINSDIKSGGVSIIGISNKISFKEILDPRSLSTLYESELVFSQYNANELYAIIKDRCTTGFKPGTIDDDVLHYISASTAREGGDARYSLKVLTKAGELADEEGKSKVTMAEAQTAMKFAENDIVFDLIATLPEHQKFVLYSIVTLTLSGGTYKKLTDGNDTYLFSGEIYHRYKSLLEGLKKEPKSERWYRKYLSELEMQGLTVSYESGKGIRGHTKLVKLLYPAKKIKDVLEKELFDASA